MSTDEVWIDQQSNVCTKSKLHSSFYWNLVECLTQKLLVCSLKCQSFRHSFQACKLTYFSKFTSIIACYFRSTAQYEMTSSSVWVWLHNNFILHQRQNRILCVNGAKMWPRLNTLILLDFGVIFCLKSYVQLIFSSIIVAKSNRYIH